MRGMLGVTFIFGGILALSLLATPSARAQTFDPKVIDVGGVRLGMTADQAIAALKASDPTAEIVDLRNGYYHSDDDLKYKQIPWETAIQLVGNQVWDSHYGIVSLSKDYRKYSSDKNSLSEKETKCLKSAKDPRDVDQCTKNAVNAMHDLLTTDLDEPRITVVFLAPVPGDEKAIAVSANFSYVRSVPTVTDTVAALKERYASPFTKEQNIDGGPGDGGKIVWWQFDARNRIIGRPDAERRGLAYIGHSGSQWIDPPSNFGELSAYVLLPSRINPGDYIDMMAVVDGSATVVDTHRVDFGITGGTPNRLLASSAHIVLYDSHALLLYQTQAQAFISGQQQAKEKAQAASSAGSKPQFK